MDAEAWIKLLHELGTIIAASAAAIAAGSSLRNGRRLKKNGCTDTRQAGHSTPSDHKKSGTSNGDSGDDWYHPPNLG